MVPERLAYLHTPVTTVDEIWHHIEAKCAAITVHTIQSQLNLMPKRIRAIIAVGGGCSGY